MYKVKTNSKEPITTNQIIFVNQKKFSAYRLNHFCRMIDEEFLITFSDTFQFKWIRGGGNLIAILPRNNEPYHRTVTVTMAAATFQ